MLKRLISSYLLYPIAECLEKRDIRTKLIELNNHYNKAFHFRAPLMRTAFIDQVMLAKHKVPYYRDLFKAIGFDPEKLKQDIRYINEIPFLDKKIIQEQGMRLLHEERMGLHKYPCKTGGSTGESTIIYYDQAAADWSAATTLFARALAGNRRHHKELHLSSEAPHKANRKDKFRENLKCLAMNRCNVFYKTFDDASLQRILLEIKRAKTHLIHGHPSTLYALAQAAQHQSNAKKLFRVFESSGEYLPRKKSDFIAEVFGCKIINRYGLAEAGVIAYQDKEDIDDLLLFDHMVWGESVLGELVITNLKNQLMPLIRYKTGDLGEVMPDARGLCVRQLRGRVHDSVRIGGQVYMTHFIQDMLDRFGGVSDFQVVAREQQSPILRVVLTAEADRERLENDVANVWGKALPIQYISQNELRLVGRRNKFRYVVTE